MHYENIVLFQILDVKLGGSEQDWKTGQVTIRDIRMKIVPLDSSDEKARENSNSISSAKIWNERDLIHVDKSQCEWMLQTIAEEGLFLGKI